MTTGGPVTIDVVEDVVAVPAEVVVVLDVVLDVVVDVELDGLEVELGEAVAVGDEVGFVPQSSAATPAEPPAMVRT